MLVTTYRFWNGTTRTTFAYRIGNLLVSADRQVIGKFIESRVYQDGVCIGVVSGHLLYIAWQNQWWCLNS